MGSFQGAPDIVFVDDLLRDSYWPGKEFFYDLLRETIHQAVGVMVGPSLRWQFMAQSGVPGADSVHSQQNTDGQPWVANYERLGPEITSYLSAVLPARCVVVGYELSPGLIAYFDERGLPWIDFRISPLRFLPDLLMAVRTSLPGIQDKIAAWSVPRSEIRMEVAKLKASIRQKERYQPDFSLTPTGQEKIYVLGQTPADASLIDGAKFVRFARYEPQLRSLFADRAVTYIPHPFAAPWHVDDDIRLLSSLAADFRAERVPLYPAMCAQHPARFVGLSSSALQEAALFDCPSETLFKDICPVEYPDQPIAVPGSYWQIPFATFVDPDFIRFLLGQDVPARRIALRAIRENELRTLHDAWWGYAEISGKPFGQMATRQTQIVQGMQVLEKRLAATSAMFLKRPDYNNSFYKKLYQDPYPWINGAILQVRPDGRIYQGDQAVALWMVPNAALEYCFFILWGDSHGMAKVVCDDQWRILSVVNNDGMVLPVPGT